MTDYTYYKNEYGGILTEEEFTRHKKAAEAAKTAPAAALVITCTTEGVDAETTAKVEALINDRAAAKKAKDFAKADAIRDELTAMGVTLVDVKGGVNWSK